MDVLATLHLITASSSLTEQGEHKKELSAYLNHLIENDFPALLQLLYRVDVSEQKLKSTLKENQGANAGDLLAELLIERQKEKAVARQMSSLRPDSTGEEAW
jgi:hypothetical protein